MYSEFTEQYKESMKPMTELMAINLKTLESLAEKQTSFFTGALSDSLAFTETMSTQTDLTGVMQVQKDFSEDFQSKLVESSKEVYSILTEAQEQATEIMKSSFAMISAMAPMAAMMKSDKPKAAKPKTAAK